MSDLRKGGGTSVIVNLNCCARTVPNGLREYCFGTSSVYIDPKSTTDIILLNKMRSRTREYAVVARNHDLYPKPGRILDVTNCVKCGFSVTNCAPRLEYTHANMTVYMDAIRYLHCPLCVDPVPAGLESEEVEQE